VFDSREAIHPVRAKRKMQKNLRIRAANTSARFDEAAQQ
jgi:hypothetical protein